MPDQETSRPDEDRCTLRIQDGVAVLTLARPDAGNALDARMARALREAVTRLRPVAGAGDVRAVVLRAEGPMICAGGDLGYFAAVPDRGEALRPVAEDLTVAVRGLADLPVPVISVVDGVAAGGGVGLALAADLVVMGPRARLKLAYSSVGLAPDCGVSVELVRRAGLGRALDLVLTDRLIDAAEAERFGLATLVSDDPEAAARDLAQRFRDGSASSLAAGKRLIRGASQAWVDVYRQEVDAIVAQVAGPDGHEGVDAFLQKRAPRFG